MLKKRPAKKDNAFLLNIWGEIILEYGKLSNNTKIQDTQEKQAYILQLQNSYTTLKAMVRYLYFISPNHIKYGDKAVKLILDLKKMGYDVNCTSSKDYKESLELIDRRINSLVTLINMKKNEIKGEATEHKIDFEEIYIMITAHFNNVPENLSVSRYLKYKRLIEFKNKQTSKAK